ncbi:Alpha crystallin/Heat shock protein,HSP20-like chaperone,Alpha crystallin/Hsp20 domain [Cinara cedri]|uniref:Alpha crystallin/Heat shock protein,HSP20-like chaperone,Alpha crystallin/Hsp20 domain n=1 Tax=Cinara cedri TaxID=506608 RepID=A0A5E4M6P1_9HEMI|nr:Alpha crystallin/Heat shock protein,HSP20-like chaperone,Alpha crystallin/Hsp20 domain [Cinara cedri]
MMSLLPFLLEDLSRPTVYDQHFGLGLLDDVLVPAEYNPHFGRDPFGIRVDGKHEERSDEHGFISRQFTRRYKIPDTVDPKLITSSLSSDGVLSVGAPKKVVNDKKEEISIPIIQTNEPSIKVSANKEKKEIEKMDTK